MCYKFIIRCTITILLLSSLPAYTAPCVGELPDVVALGQARDFDGIIIGLLGNFPKDKVENRISFLERLAKEGLVGKVAVYTHLERHFAEECLKQYTDDQSIVCFLATLDGIPEWIFPANTTLCVVRDGEVYIAEKVLRVKYKFCGGWLETEFEEIGLDSRTPLRPNKSATVFTGDLSVYDGRYYSPDNENDNTVFALYAVMPRLSVGGQLWPERNRDSFNMRLVSRERELL